MSNNRAHQTGLGWPLARSGEGVRWFGGIRPCVAPLGIRAHCRCADCLPPLRHGVAFQTLAQWAESLRRGLCCGPHEPFHSRELVDRVLIELLKLANPVLRRGDQRSGSRRLGEFPQVMFPFPDCVQMGSRPGTSRSDRAASSVRRRSASLRRGDHEQSLVGDT